MITGMSVAALDSLGVLVQCWCPRIMKKRYIANKTKRRAPVSSRKPGAQRSGGGPKPGAGQTAMPFTPRVSGHLKTILEEIGTPEDRPFRPDPFQVESLEKLASGDVVVSVPTGAGKTYIAVEAMSDLLARGGRCWYASPLKALSNSKYIEFGRRFGPENVGLLTGDHKVNPDAPIIVGTTEILRNQLYDAMSVGQDLSTDLVVMDEAHYLGDIDRGVVWEEVIIYLPPRVRLLLLSATVANAREIAEWLSFVRGNEPQAVVTHERPVPLHPLFLFPDGLMMSLSKGRKLAPQIRHFIEQNPSRGRRSGQSSIPMDRILEALDRTDLLPAIFFLKSRSDCDEALIRCSNRTRYLQPERRARLGRRLDGLLDRYPFLKTHPHINHLRAGIAAHHAGHMPHWKLVIEQLMQEGLLSAIFSTSTVAAGVNFPARTVAISQSDRFNGHEFVDLTATELLQMTGRAGRRGMDRIGFALIVPGPFQKTELIQSLFGAESDPVLSRIQINFSMVLNLLSSHNPDQIKNLLDQSLAAFQQSRSHKAKEAARFMSQLGEEISGGACEGPEQALHFYAEGRRLAGDLDYLTRLEPHLTWESALRTGLTPGRLFEVYGGKRLCALEHMERRDRAGVLAAKVKEDLGLKKGQVRGKWVPLARIRGLTETCLDIDPEKHAREAVKLIRKAAVMDHPIMDPAEMMADENDARLSDLKTRLNSARTVLEELPCPECPIHYQCWGDESSTAVRLMKRIRRLEAKGRTSGRMLWSSFVRHLDFLKTEGFVGPDDELTDDGQWAANLRLDHPLLIAAGIKASAWPEDDPALLAALVAPFVVDKEQIPEDSPGQIAVDLAGAWMKLETSVTPLAGRLNSSGFATPALKFRAALAIHTWAIRGDWEEAVQKYGHDPGDMAMLVFRTADNLRQMAGLSATHPKLAPTARKAVELIMKEPVVVPL